MLETPRLLLRRWRAGDLKAFALLNQDSRVMEYFPRIYAPEESQKMIDGYEACFEKNGYEFWACERRSDGLFCGFIGLNEPGFSPTGAPCVEIGWRLAAETWGQGYAPEGAGRVL